jgi:hypothetical protein
LRRRSYDSGPGVAGTVKNVGVDFVTFIRAIVILCAAGTVPFFAGQAQARAAACLGVDPQRCLSDALEPRHRRLGVLLFPRAEGRRCGARGPYRQAQRGARGDFRALFLGDKLAPQNRIGVAPVELGAMLVAFKS